MPISATGTDLLPFILSSNNATGTLLSKEKEKPKHEEFSLA